MNDEHGLRQFERVADVIGAAPALRLCARYGPQGMIYVPATVSQNHAIAGVIGDAPFAMLVAAFGGQTISVASLEFIDALRAAGQVDCLRSYNLPTRVIAACVGRGIRRVEMLKKQLSEGDTHGT